MKYYLVPEHELKNLLHDNLTLCALEGGGVDNWDWYGQSIADFLDDAEEDYNVPFGVDFDIDDMVEVDIRGYKSIEVDE